MSMSDRFLQKSFLDPGHIKPEAARQGKCIDCGEHIEVYVDGSRSKCLCDKLGMTPQEYAYRYEGYCGYCKCTPCQCDGHGKY